MKKNDKPNFDSVWAILEENARQLVKLKESQDRTDAQLAESEDRLSRALAKTDEQLAETNERLSKALAKTDAQLAKTDAQISRGEKKLEKIDVLAGHISNNIGDSAEDYFFYSLSEEKVLNDIQYDDVLRNQSAHRQKVQDEFDIVMVNGECIALIEAKHKLHKNDVDIVVEKKASNYQYLFPYYSDHKIYLAVAGLAVPEKVEKLALSHGLIVIKQKGDFIEVIGEGAKVY